MLLPTKFRVNWTISRWDIAENDFQYGGRPPFWILKNFGTSMLRRRPWKQNLRLHTKFHWNRIISGRDIAIKPFSKWQPSAILNFRNLVFWSHDLCLNVIMLLATKFRVNRTKIIEIYAKKTIFNMAAVRHIGFATFWYFVMRPSLEPKFASISSTLFWKSTIRNNSSAHHPIFTEFCRTA